MCHVTGVSIEVIEDFVAGIVPMNDHFVFRDDLKSPRLGVVAAGCPAGTLENADNGFRRMNATVGHIICPFLQVAASPDSASGVAADYGRHRAARYGCIASDKRRTDFPRVQASRPDDLVPA